jgi:ribosomal protein S18 acetylase RimI-like enzyme
MLSHLACRLHRHAEAEALALAVDARNRYAMRLYQAFGFAETHRRACWICFPKRSVGANCA